jgi:hypothetical protein
MMFGELNPSPSMLHCTVYADLIHFQRTAQDLIKLQLFFEQINPVAQFRSLGASNF